ncbi:nucleoside/nucleotide kinase family protein [Roseinatronobacter bogoriensis]|uniref:Nucleoside/nucleotide kinase family protein n=1 Tax=Roseinatronobacter bogoriensis subsp. barguzinensis TaxID=441209 RepID=A0A2K8KHH7_9RHOB|nr:MULTISPECIES: nucleoside/nucleotide kinase family protein [Rhodobaca]ATX67433.1 nucleoside/nucleotide kinase family protein [Rhodobaca barguzinensis]MBB4207017.1 fructokinase [Rhodobaca bogoriensis DSM 18756]TDW36051.1 fructokinase [Rhodobaca barguzinensis]TDY74064.1 fructokinase [Rhodobaca bogoriensis DSM 18756]
MSVAQPLDSISPDLLKRLRDLHGTGRKLIAVAGAPASGKSVLGMALRDALRRNGQRAELVPMDGFHLDNRLLDARGLRARKGAPESFDVAGFIALVRRLRSDAEVVYPLFDRARDLSIAGAGVISPDCEMVIIEGNYLLFDEKPWSDLAALWDFSIWLDTAEDTILQRCVARWLGHGHDLDAARKRAEGNDLANARRIIAARLDADMTLSE